MRTILAGIGLALALAACQGAEPTARNANGTLALLGSGNYVYNRTTGSYSRFSADIHCQEPALSVQAAGCAAINGDGGGAGGAGGK
jgi:hypothetical protein